MPIPLGILAAAGAGAGAASDFELLETTILSVNTATITFSNLNNYSAYKHLQVRAVTRGSSTFTIEPLAMRANGVTFNAYSHRLSGNGSSVSSGSLNENRRDIATNVGDSASANIFAASVIDILDFASTSKHKTVRAFSGAAASSSEVSLRSGLMTGDWEAVEAITSISFFQSGGGNIVAGSRFSLYGIK